MRFVLGLVVLAILAGCMSETPPPRELADATPRSDPLPIGSSVGSFIRPIHIPEGAAGFPRVSPDHRYIAMEASDRVTLLRVTSGGDTGPVSLARVAHHDGDLKPALWLPDSSGLLVAPLRTDELGKERTLAILELDGRLTETSVRVGRDACAACWARLSPGRDLIALEVDRKAVVVHRDGSHARVVADASPLAWDAQGNLVLGRFDRIWATRPDGARAYEVPTPAGVKGLTVSVQTKGIARDGRAFLVSFLGCKCSGIHIDRLLVRQRLAEVPSGFLAQFFLGNELILSRKDRFFAYDVLGSDPPHPIAPRSRGSSGWGASAEFLVEQITRGRGVEVRSWLRAVDLRDGTSRDFAHQKAWRGLDRVDGGWYLATSNEKSEIIDLPRLWQEEPINRRVRHSQTRNDPSSFGPIR